MSETNVITAPAQNSLTDLMKAFSCEGRPVTPVEFRPFWSSLTDAEKAWYKSQPLS